MPTFSLAGTFNFQPTPEAKSVAVPLAFAGEYTQKSMVDFAFTADQTNLAIGQGTVTAPRIVVVFVRTGRLTLSWAADGAGGIEIAANPTPPPADVPTLVLIRHDPSTAQLYVTTTEPCSGSIWVLA